MIAAADLFQRAGDWISIYSNADHLRQAVHWLRVLEPDASLALLLAALTHDMERAFPGPDRIDFDARLGPADPGYNRHHAERSARLVADWLRAEGAPDDLIVEVGRLIRAHEDGGWPEADLLQAADSLSFLEVNGDLLRSWLPNRRYHTGPAEAREKLHYTYERIRIGRARELAWPMYQRELARIDADEAAERGEAPPLEGSR